MRLDLLVVATNEVLKLGNSASAADLWKSFLTCCEVLRVLEEDEQFFQRVEDSAAGQLPDSVAKTFDDIGQFEAFLRVEEKCLIDAGVEREVAQALARQARHLRVTARHWHDSPKDIRVQVRKLCNETCEAADQLKRLRDINEHRERLWRLVSRLGKGLGGATFVVADLAAAAAIGQAYALVSTTVGTTLLGMALQDEKPK